MNLLPKRVAVISRLRAGNGRTMAENVARARRLCEAANRAGVAPFAPHLLYPQWLDDTLPAERVQGIESGRAWIAGSEEAWVDSAYGIASGMEGDIETAKAAGARVVVDPECWRGIE